MRVRRNRIAATLEVVRGPLPNKGLLQRQIFPEEFCGIQGRTSRAMLKEHVLVRFEMKPKSKPAKSEPGGSQPSEFENFANAVRTIMAVPKTAIDPHKPIRPRNGAKRANGKPSRRPGQN